MRAIIHGTLFDTETAEKIGKASGGGLGWSDFSYWEADLCKTPRSGKYFLAGSGGPMTQFRQTLDDNTWGFGERIIPMNRETAFGWAQEYIDPKTVLEEFGDLVQA